MDEEVVGFTQKQRLWFLGRDGNRCQFHEYRRGKWIRCGCRSDLQVHHIIPRGWSRFHMPRHFPVNGSLNGIVLCKYHHVGKGSVHQDTYEALLLYRNGEKKAYNLMMQRRIELNEQGIPYWNTQWDLMLSRIAKKQTGRYSRIISYPTNGNRGNNGRLGVRRL